MLATYPLEHMAARTARVNPEETHRLYAALARVSGARRPVTVADPHVAADVVAHADGRRFVWLVSQSAEPLVVRPQTDGRLHGLSDGAPVEDVRIDAYGVVVLELR